MRVNFSFFGGGVESLCLCLTLVVRGNARLHRAHGGRQEAERESQQVHADGSGLGSRVCLMFVCVCLCDVDERAV